MLCYRYCLLILFVLTCFSSRAQQQTDSSKPVFKVLDSVEVSTFMNPGFIKPVSSTATKIPVQVIDIPQSLSSITRSLIDDKMDFTLKDAVTGAANVNDYSGYDEYSIRGFLAENPRSVNGLRGYNSTYSSLMLLNIESIDVLKGPAAVLYGNTDPGGTVNLITKKPLTETYGEVALFGGSWDHFRAVGDFSGPANKSKSILYRLNAGYDQSNGFSDMYYSKAYQVAPSFTIIPCKNVTVHFDFSLSQVNTILNRGQPGLKDDNNLFATPVGLTVNQPGDYLKQMDLASMISVAWSISDKLSFHTAYLNYLTNQNVAEHGLQSYIDYDSVNLYFQKWTSNTSTNSWSNYFNYKFATGQLVHDALVGYDYISTDGNVNQTHYEDPGAFGVGSGIVGTFNLLHPAYNQKSASSYQVSDNQADAVDLGNYYTQGIYLQDQITYKKWMVLLGLRREFYRSDSDEGLMDSSATVENVWLPRFGLVYSITPDLHVYGVYSRGFDPYEISNTLQVFSQPFKPVNSELFEVGLKAMMLKGKLYGTISLYQLSIYNVAVNANDPSNPDLYLQRGEDQARGGELELNGNILPNLQVHFAYAYNLARIKQSEIKSEIGRLKENAPVNSSNGFLKYNFVRGGLKNFSVSGGYVLIGKRNTLDENLVLPGYFTMQAGINYQYHQLTGSLLMNNIGNVVYWSGAYNNIYKWPGAERNFMCKLSWDLPFSKAVKH